MSLYAVTVFLGALLLFQIQPIIAKVILPWFGGTAAVWTTCLLFFQVALLAGYLYAHLLVRFLSPWRQAAVHVALLAASLLALPVAAEPGTNTNGDPVPRILTLLALSIGLPYFLLSATSPLVQAWYGRRRGAVLPYRLYALSNLASLIALLAYPVLVEPHSRTHTQTLAWSALYAAFAVLCGACAAVAARKAPAGPTGASEDSLEDAPPGSTLKLLWLALAACGSTLLLAVTNHLCHDVAPVPFLWVLPLSLYLLSFVLCFDRENWYQPRLFRRLLISALVAMVGLVLTQQVTFPLKLLVPVFAAGLFVCCMCCHGELARLKPAPRYLTSFYVMVSLGGALGGLYVGVIAPQIYAGYFEMRASLAICAVLALAVAYGHSSRARITAALVMATLIALAPAAIRPTEENTRFVARNFYGVVRVSDSVGPRGPVRRLHHGHIIHGSQFLTPDLRRLPTMYYGPSSGAGLAFQPENGGPRRAGIIGLGAGTMAVYARPGDVFRFYEINPLVVRIAQTEFTYLRDCRGRVEVALGDARLSLEHEPDQRFDVLAVDAFAGDSIPLHLLTREAFELYFRHLKPGGILAVHISNYYLDLGPVVGRLADALGREARQVENGDDRDRGVATATWVLAAARELYSRHSLKSVREPVPLRPAIRLWTDDYSNLFQILK